jgi:hypothetical protein
MDCSNPALSGQHSNLQHPAARHACSMPLATVCGAKHTHQTTHPGVERTVLLLPTCRKQGLAGMPSHSSLGTSVKEDLVDTKQQGAHAASNIWSIYTVMRFTASGAVILGLWSHSPQRPAAQWSAPAYGSRPRQASPSVFGNTNVLIFAPGPPIGVPALTAAASPPLALDSPALRTED